MARVAEAAEREGMSSHAGSLNAGHFTVRDDSLPHQIRLHWPTKQNSEVIVGCSCGRLMEFVKVGEGRWLSTAWDIYDEHTMSSP